MTTCPLPSEWNALRPVDVANPTCDELLNILLNGNNLLADFAGCWFNEDGTLAPGFVEEICATSC